MLVSPISTMSNGSQLFSNLKHMYNLNQMEKDDPKHQTCSQHFYDNTILNYIGGGQGSQATAPAQHINHAAAAASSTNLTNTNTEHANANHNIIQIIDEYELDSGYSEPVTDNVAPLSNVL